MNILAQCTWILWQFLVCQSLEIKPELYEMNEEVCKKQARDPYFDLALVVRKPWRIYYTWNMKMGNKCFDMVFKNATQNTIRRIWTDMTDVLDQQPYWDSSALYLRTKVGPSVHEALLFADQGPAGRFLAVPNMQDPEYISSSHKKVPLLKFLIKLVRDGRFLLVMDCFVGGASLAARHGERPYRVEVAAAAASLKLGDGYPACIADKHMDEQLYLN